MHSCHKIILLILLLVCTGNVAKAIVKAGISANGKNLSKGDTVKVCKGSSIIFVSNAQGVTDDSIRWTFQNGTPPTYIGASTSVSYSNNGVNKVTQRVSNEIQKDSLIVYVAVSDATPPSSFIFSPNNVCASSSIKFTGPAGNKLSYLWDFSDGTTSDSTNPVHIFTSATGNGSQTFNVMLTTTNEYSCTSTSTQTVTVKQIPDASLDRGDNNENFSIFNGIPTFSRCDVQSSYMFSFKNVSTTTATNTSYDIDWGDGSPHAFFDKTWALGSIITHTFSKGNTIVTLTVKGLDGCLSNIKYNVYLGTDAAVTLGKPKDTNICQDSSVSFPLDKSVLTSNSFGTYYTFSVDDGSPTIYYPSFDALPSSFLITHTFLKSSCGLPNNAFTANFIAYNACSATGSSATVQPIYVSGKTAAAVSFPFGNVACLGSSALVTDNSFLGGEPPACNQTSTRVWVISPSAGVTVTGMPGSFKGDNTHTNSSQWMSGDATLSLAFTKTGTYNVTLYVSNQSHCSGGTDSTTNTICVRNPPKASFTIDKLFACDDTTITLQNKSAAGGCDGDTYFWDINSKDIFGCSPSQNYNFVQNTTNVSVSPKVQFMGAGQYYISLTASALNAGSSCAVSTFNDTFTVKTKPVVNLNDLSPVCIGNPLNATATVTNCYSVQAPKYAWTFTGSTTPTSTADTPKNIIYTTAGTYPVKLSVQNECGISTDVDSAHIIAKPVALAGANKTVCSGNIFSIGKNTETGFIYKWSPSTGLSDATVAQPTITLAYNGKNDDTTYKYILNVSAGASCQDNDTVLVKVKKSPSLIINPIDTIICSGSSARIIASGADTYLWSPSAGLNTSINDTVIAKPSTTTAYTLIGTLNNGCKDTVVSTINIAPAAKASFTATHNSGCINFHLEDVISVHIYPDTNGIYYWYANNKLIDSTTGNFPGYVMTIPGDSVIIKLVVSSKYGCKKDSMQMKFYSLPSVLAQFKSSITSGCGPLKVSFTNTSSLINNVEFFWDFGNGIISTQTQPGTITYNNSPFNNDTSYYVILKAYNGCDTTRWFDTINVSANPKARFGIDSTFGCSPYTFTVTNTSLGHPSIYYWNLGDGTTFNTASNAPFKHTYSTGVLDTFNIQLIAVNNCARDTQTIAVIVSPNPVKPQININGNQASGCAPATITFNNNTTGATKYTWDFGDSSALLITTNNDAEVLHTYTQPGSFTVKTEITNGCSDTTVFNTVMVFQKPVAAFSVNKTNFCFGDTVKTTATITNADSYRWDWGDDTVSSGTEAAHVYANSGTYNITLFADRINNFGIVCSDETQKTINVIAKPNTTISANNNAVNCAPFILNATAPGLTKESLQWSIIDSTNGSNIFSSNNKELSYTFSNQGTYYIRLSAENTATCSDSSKIKLHVYFTPVAAFTAAQGACTNDTIVNFANTGTYKGFDALNYTWLVNNQIISSQQNTSYHFVANAALPQTFNTALIEKNTVGCSDTATSTFTLYPRATAAFTLNNPQTCVPFVTSINNTSTNAIAYKWLINNISASTSQNPTLVIDKPATDYTVSLIVQSPFTCPSDTASYNFKTLPKPAAFFIASDTLGCSGSLSVSINNTTTGAVNYTWIWGDGTLNSNLQSPSHFYANSGQYQINLIADDNTCKDTATQTISIEQNPIADFSTNTIKGCDTVVVQFSNLSSNAFSYLWSFSDNTTSTLAEPVKSFPPSANAYTVKLIAYGKYGCSATATKPTYINAVVAPNADFTVFPSQIVNTPNYTLQFINNTLELTTYSYLWNMGDGSHFTTRDVQKYNYKDTGVYPVSLAVTDAATNCTDTAIKIVQITGVPGYLYVPNAFCTKCADINLRTFLPKGKGLQTYHLQILTTWGQLLFETTALDATGAPNQPWNGSDVKGRGLEQDVYIWKIDATFINGTEWKGMKYPYANNYKRTGTITIIK